MAVVNNHKSFEQSLRSASPFAPLLRPIKSEIHKGCTGKAHGCGTRKNSRSTYSSLSDSSSEVSPAPSVIVNKSVIKRTQSQRRATINTSCESLPKATLTRANSLRSTKSNTGKTVDSKPPWHNVYTAKLTGIKSEVTNGGNVARNETPDRAKKPRKPSVHWQELYDKAIDQKWYGGSYTRYPDAQIDAKSASAVHQVKANPTNSVGRAHKRL